MKKRAFVFGIPARRGRRAGATGVRGSRERERRKGKGGKRCNCNLYLLLSAGRMGIVLQERNELSLYEARRANGNRYF
jgi:hypothetical protein